VAHLARCEEVVGAGDDWRGLAGEVALARAAVALRDTDWREAGVAAEQAVSVFQDYRLPWRQVAALQTWGRALAGSGRKDEARARHGEADAVLARVGAPERWRSAELMGAPRPHRASTRPQRASTTLGP
jgi:ABC-type taurine transport system ATPase subunit